MENIAICKTHNIAVLAQWDTAVELSFAALRFARRIMARNANAEGRYNPFSLIYHTEDDNPQQIAPNYEINLSLILKREAGASPEHYGKRSEDIHEKAIQDAGLLRRASQGIEISGKASTRAGIHERVTFHEHLSERFRTRTVKEQHITDRVRRDVSAMVSTDAAKLQFIEPKPLLFGQVLQQNQKAGVTASADAPIHMRAFQRDAAAEETLLVLARETETLSKASVSAQASSHDVQPMMPAAQAPLSEENVQIPIKDKVQMSDSISLVFAETAKATAEKLRDEISGRAKKAQMSDGAPLALAETVKATAREEQRETEKLRDGISGSVKKEHESDGTQLALAETVQSIADEEQRETSLRNEISGWAEKAQPKLDLPKEPQVSLHYTVGSGELAQSDIVRQAVSKPADFQAQAGAVTPPAVYDATKQISGSIKNVTTHMQPMGILARFGAAAQTLQSFPQNISLQKTDITTVNSFTGSANPMPMHLQRADEAPMESTVFNSIQHEPERYADYVIPGNHLITGETSAHDAAHHVPQETKQKATGASAALHTVKLTHLQREEMRSSFTIEKRQNIRMTYSGIAEQILAQAPLASQPKNIGAAALEQMAAFVAHNAEARQPLGKRILHRMRPFWVQAQGESYAYKEKNAFIPQKRAEQSAVQMSHVQPDMDSHEKAAAPKWAEQSAVQLLHVQPDMYPHEQAAVPKQQKKPPVQQTASALQTDFVQAAQNEKAGFAASVPMLQQRTRDIRMSAGRAYQAQLPLRDSQQTHSGQEHALAPVGMELLQKNETEGAPVLGHAAQNNSEGYQESSYVKSLPDWARDFLKDSYTHPAPQVEQPAAMMATTAQQYPPNRAWTSGGQQQPQQGWAAPGYAGAVKMTHKQPEKEERQSSPFHISETEINRMANKVYGIIEERLRRNNRRMGL